MYIIIQILSLTTSIYLFFTVLLDFKSKLFTHQNLSMLQGLERCSALTVLCGFYFEEVVTILFPILLSALALIVIAILIFLLKRDNESHILTSARFIFGAKQHQGVSMPERVTLRGIPTCICW